MVFSVHGHFLLALVGRIHFLKMLLKFEFNPTPGGGLAHKPRKRCTLSS
jgi:hypothetical protein